MLFDLFLTGHPAVLRSLKEEHMIHRYSCSSVWRLFLYLCLSFNSTNHKGISVLYRLKSQSYLLIWSPAIGTDCTLQLQLLHVTVEASILI